MASKDTRGIEIRTLSDGSKRFKVKQWDPVNKQFLPAKTLTTLAAAQQYRDQTRRDIENGLVGRFPRKTVRDAADAWLKDALTGVARNRSGEVYAPSVIRGYEAKLVATILPTIGSMQLVDLHQPRVQRIADDALGTGLASSTVRNTVTALRVVLRYAIRRGWLAINVCDGVELPMGGRARDRVATPLEASVLLHCLPDRDRALWATAVYAGLRRGELQALRWEDIDLVGGTIRVVRSFDPLVKPGIRSDAIVGWPSRGGGAFVRVKTKAGQRVVPIPTVLRTVLLASNETTGLVFGVDPNVPFNDSAIKRAHKMWSMAGKQVIGLHECRHTYASFMIAAGVNIKALQHYMGHSSVTVTLDRYGHLLPGNEDVAAGLLDEFLTSEMEKVTDA